MSLHSALRDEAKKQCGGRSKRRINADKHTKEKHLNKNIENTNQ